MRDDADFAPDTTVLDAMQAWGAPPEEIEAVRAQLAAATSAAAAFEIYADNLQIVGAFVALRTQWLYAGLDCQRVGLNYAGVCAWLDQHIPRPRRRRPLLRGIQTMEHAVLQADHERRDKEE